MPLSKNPIYNLKAVLKETGLKADVLRAWERRYGLPAPERTQGGHRLYSQLDIETIKWLIARQNDGFSISRAVEHWRELEASSRDPFADYPQTDVSDSLAFSGSPTSLEALRAEWLKACLAFNETSAEQALNRLRHITNGESWLSWKNVSASDILADLMNQAVAAYQHRP